MRISTFLVGGALAAALLAPATIHAQGRKTKGATPTQSAAPKGSGTSDKQSGPADRPRPAGALANATCNDGSLYSGTSRQGACSGHGGVKAWADGAKAPRPKNATALCKDGSWHTKAERRGACGGHGGVEEWLKR